MGKDISKLQQILAYYIFQKKIKKNINNDNSIDNYKRGKCYFIHPEWIEGWKNIIGYGTIKSGLDNLNIKSTKLDENQRLAINSFIKENNLYFDVDISFLTKIDNFIPISEMPITEKLLENLVDSLTFSFLNISRTGTKYEALDYIFKQKMIIFIFSKRQKIKLLVHSLSPYKVINNLICLTFTFKNYTKFNEFVTTLTNNNSTTIINYLLSVNIFNDHNYEGKDEFNNPVFFLTYEEVNNFKFINNQNEKNNDNNIDNLQLNTNMLRISYNNTFNNNEFNKNNNSMNTFNNNQNQISDNNNYFSQINNYKPNNNNQINNYNMNLNMNNMNNMNNNFQNNNNFSKNNIVYQNNYNNNFNQNSNFQTENNFNNNQNINNNQNVNNNNFNNNNYVNNNDIFNLQNKINQLEILLAQEKEKNNELSLENKNLKNEIKKKEEQENNLNKKINQLQNQNMMKLKLNDNNTLHNAAPDEKIFAIHIVSMDQTINRSIACKDSNTFVHIEEKLYEEYPELKNTDNYFVVSGRKIKRFLSIKENDIHDGDNIIINY